MIELIIYTALKIVCIHALCWEGNLLHKTGVTKRMWNVPVLIKKPLFECLFCMSSLWGIIFWFTSGGSLCMDMVDFILCLAGVMCVIDIALTSIAIIVKHMTMPKV